MAMSRPGEPTGGAGKPRSTGPAAAPGPRAYGLEPLVLPPRPLPFPDAPADRPPAGAPLDTAAEEAAYAGTLDLSDPDHAERLFWFRWITGHQASFVLWQLTAAALAEASGASGKQRPAAVERAVSFVRGYSALLLYTSSCPADLYHRVIRPSMVRHHPAMSGSWASDYGSVRSLYSGRDPLLKDECAAGLRREIALNTLVHEGVAETLVPSGASLFHTSVTQGGPLLESRGTLVTLYDLYFLTLRDAHTSYESLLAQLEWRLKAICADVTVNTLRPAIDGCEPRTAARLRDPAVVDVEWSVPAVLRQAMHASRGPSAVLTGTHVPVSE
ncbi:L-tyrosine 3-hydroxylase [Streptomyces sp. NPDC087512]|uniref:L-tyrosine 3-hydroxylase n=1 Tax=Streptomyces sp. NPDC087512 TaxID=3155059 RepID=UPI00344978C3